MTVALEHRSPFTVADLADTPDDGRRYEIQNGVLFVTPPPHVRHNSIADQLWALLRTAAPPDVFVYTASGVTLGSDEEFRIPDVIVTTVHHRDVSRYHDASQVLAAVEIVSPGSRTIDRVTKPAVYSAAGIPCLWRVETDRFPGQLPGEQLPVVFVYRLTSDGGELVARLSAGSVGTAPLPFPVAFDPATLLD